MKNRELVANIILQTSIIFIIFNLFYFEKLNFNKLNFLFTSEAIILIVLLLISKLFLSILFSFALKILSKKGEINKITKIYLQGGLANEAVPGLGYIYRYKKFKNEFGISIAEYSLVQTLNNLFILFGYLFLAIIFGYLKIEINTKVYFFFLVTSLLIIFLFIIYRYRSKLLHFRKLKKLYYEYSIIKKELIKNYNKFLVIFFFYFLQCILQCLIFYRTAKFFEFDLSFIDTSYLYISSILMTFVSFTNFVGIFELALTFTSSFFTINYEDMWFVGLGFRIMGIVALLMIISIFYILTLKKNK